MLLILYRYISTFKNNLMYSYSIHKTAISNNYRINSMSPLSQGEKTECTLDRSTVYHKTNTPSTHAGKGRSQMTGTVSQYNTNLV